MRAPGLTSQDQPEGGKGKREEDEAVKGGKLMGGRGNGLKQGDSRLR